MAAARSPRRCPFRPPDWHLRELKRRIAAAHPGAAEPAAAVVLDGVIWDRVRLRYGLY